MSVQYVAVGWNRQKRIYDSTLAGLIALYLAVFAAGGSLLHPQATIETLLIRGLGTLALLLLHVILAIGPLCRLDKRFLPLLYNRRHLGVTMFFVALAHGVLAIVQFHGYANVNPIISLLTSNANWGSVAEFPFESLGLAALLILFLMAATSHDFWLHNLGPRVWKTLHMAVYFAYALLTGHVALGALQSETSPLLAVLLFAGMGALIGLHLAAARKESRKDSARAEPAEDGFVEVCDLESIPDGRATVVNLGGERVAVFRIGNQAAALSNVCQHQNGPLGEGRIIDGCVTCPWHGYQYDPFTGCSPPPYTDRVPVFRTKIVEGKVLVSEQ
jgi:DMSO/TMAO reductase YedYZ heme-binding membrane subunit